MKITWLEILSGVLLVSALLLSCLSGVVPVFSVADYALSCGALAVGTLALSCSHYAGVKEGRASR